MNSSKQTNSQVLPTYVAPLNPVYNANSRLEAPPAYSSPPQMNTAPQQRSGITKNEAECCCLGLYCLCCCFEALLTST